jgi:hypothetical protein
MTCYASNVTLVHADSKGKCGKLYKKLEKFVVISTENKHNCVKYSVMLNKESCIKKRRIKITERCQNNGRKITFSQSEKQTFNVFPSICKKWFASPHPFFIKILICKYIINFCENNMIACTSC